MAHRVIGSERWPRRTRIRIGLLAGAAFLLSVVCLTLGGLLGLLWATTEPQNAPHAGLYLGLPAGVLLLHGSAMALAGTSIHRRWTGYRLAAPILIALVPAVCLTHQFGFEVAGMVGLAPFMLLAELLAP